MPGPGIQVGWGRPGWRVWVALALGCVVAGVVLIARLAGGDDTPATDVAAGQPASPSRAPAGTPSTTSASEVPDDGVHTSGGATAVPPAALEAGTRFVRAWVAHAPPTTAAEWWQGVSRYADETLGQQLRSVELTEIPANRVTGEATGNALSPTSAEIRVPTDAGTVVLLCVLVESRWFVATVDLRSPS